MSLNSNSPVIMTNVFTHDSGKSKAVDISCKIGENRILMDLATDESNIILANWLKIVVGVTSIW